ncbi:hypothetical protein ABIE01_001521 [Lactococcus lactis]
MYEHFKMIHIFPKKFAFSHSITTVFRYNIKIDNYSNTKSNTDLNTDPDTDPDTDLNTAFNYIFIFSTQL